MDIQGQYEVMARRWRPQAFSELVGQDHIVRTLRNAIEKNRIAHAYLLVGPRGTGKTTTARLFAMAMNAQGGPSVDFDIHDPICQAILKGSCLDVIEIDGASNNSVDQIRELREQCVYAPAQCRYKIYILDEVHMLTSSAFNALLKTLEEPPAHVKFIFATTEVHKVPATILSRCQRFNFRPISEEALVQKLQEITSAEKIEIAPEALLTIARLANGGMRDAESILEQLVTFCGSKITEEDILSIYGLVGAQELNTMKTAILERNISKVLELAQSWHQQGLDLYRALLDLKESFKRDLFRDLHQVSDGVKRLIPIIDVCTQYEPQLKNSISEITTFSMALLKAVESTYQRPIVELLKELE